MYPAIPEREPLALITSSDPSPRPVVLDPNTGKHWRPLSENQGMSFSQVLVSIVDEFSREPAAIYDVQSLILQIPRLGYFVFPDDTVYFDVKMVLVPGTEPMQFRVVRAEDVDE